MRNLDFHFGFYGKHGFSFVALSSTMWKVERVSILIWLLRFKRWKKKTKEEGERMIVAAIGINAKYFM